MLLATLISISVPASIGYPVLFAFVAAESAGAFVPGETSLIVAAALAAQGHLSLPLVIAVAAAAAILGDNVGYVIGRKGLRRLGERPGRRAALLAKGETFFARHGPAAVFLARWLPGLRVVAAWLAGAGRMPWRRFVIWNALGGIAWASSVGGLGYLLGRSASGTIGLVGLAVVAVVLGLWLVAHVRVRRRSRPESGCW